MESLHFYIVRPPEINSEVVLFKQLLYSPYAADGTNAKGEPNIYSSLDYGDQPLFL